MITSFQFPNILLLFICLSLWKNKFDRSDLISYISSNNLATCFVKCPYIYGHLMQSIYAEYVLSNSISVSGKTSYKDVSCSCLKILNHHIYSYIFRFSSKWVYSFLPDTLFLSFLLLMHNFGQNNQILFIIMMYQRQHIIIHCCIQVSPNRTARKP